MGNWIGIIIGIVTGIVTGAIGFWLLYHRKEKDELTAERDKAQKDKDALENQLEEAIAQIGDLKNESTEKTERISTLEGELIEKTAQIGDLKNESTEKTERISTLEGELIEKTAQVDNLTNQLEKAGTRISTLEGELIEKTAQVDNLTNQLKDANTKIVRLETQLEEANSDIVRRETQLTVANSKIVRLETQLEEANSDIVRLETQTEGLSRNLKLIFEHNKQALWLVHLFELSLQATAVALCNERVQVVHLIKKYQELEKKYQELYQEFDTTAQDYKNFREEVERRARRRLFKAGIGVALSFVPGVGLIQILSDLGGILDFITQASEDASDLSDLLKSFELSDDAVRDLENLVSVASTLLLMPEVPLDQDTAVEPVALTPKSQSVVKDTFEKYLDADVEVLAISDLNAFVRNLIQEMNDLVESLPNIDRQKVVRITNIVNNFGQFDVAYYNYDPSPKALTDGS